MNLRRKSRCKLKIFGSFGGGKSRPRQFRSEADLTSGGDKSVPVLLGIKHNHEDFGSIQHLDRVIDRHRCESTRANNARQLNLLISLQKPCRDSGAEKQRPLQKLLHVLQHKTYHQTK